MAFNIYANQTKAFYYSKFVESEFVETQHVKCPASKVKTALFWCSVIYSLLPWR